MLQERKEKLYLRYQEMFSRLYSISICKKNEIDEVAYFIDNYWKKDHALVKSRVLMDWQYFNRVSNTYNFILARSRVNGEIHAIEGFIPTTQFDPGIQDPMTWGAIWKTRSNVAPPGLGMAVKMYREHEYSSPFASEVGISKDAEKYNQQLGNTIFCLEPWYMRNMYMHKYKLIKATALEYGSIVHKHSNIKTKYISAEDWRKSDFNLKGIPPFKSRKYYEGRYFKHPFYDYKALLLSDGEEDEVIFYRIVECNDSRCIFFVDYIGLAHVLGKSHACLTEIMKKYSAEYILFLCYGIDERYLIEAGFHNRWKSDDVVPIYYEPFVKQNVDIMCASRSKEIIWPSFKGDADQDRPNIIS